MLNHHLVAGLCLATHCLAGSACRARVDFQMERKATGGGASKAVRSKAEPWNEGNEGNWGNWGNQNGS